MATLTSTSGSYLQCFRSIKFHDVRTNCDFQNSQFGSDTRMAKSYLIFNTVRKFESDLTRLQNFVGENSKDARLAFSKAIIEISNYDPNNIIINLTDSKSIYFRIYKSPNYEAHFELFYSNEENDGVEVVATVYNKDQVILKTFGTLEEVSKIIRKKIAVSSEKPVARISKYALSY